MPFLEYTNSVQIRWTQSASKHGISQEDALNAIVRHRIHVTPYGASRVECWATLLMTTWKPAGVTFGDDGRRGLSDGAVALVPSTA